MNELKKLKLWEHFGLLIDYAIKLRFDYICNMKYSELKKSLKKHKLRVTDCRMDVLDHFQQQNKALSFKDLEDKFQEYDRSNAL